MKEMENKETYKLVGGDVCKKALTDNPTYKLFWRSGYAYRGAVENEILRYEGRRKLPLSTKIVTFEELMQRKYDWAAAIDIIIDHYKKEIHMNGFSENDLW